MADLVASSRVRKVGKALFVYKRNDDSMDARITIVMARMKAELERKGIDVTEDESDKGCNTAIMFVTKDFLDDRYHDITEIRNRFTTFNCSMIICDDKDRKFVNFVKYCVFQASKCSFEEDRAREIDGYEPTVEDVDQCIKTLVLYSKPKHRIIIPGVSPATDDEVKKFVADFADEAVQVFNPAHLDYDIIDPALELDLKAIYSQVLSESDRIFQDGSSSDNLSFVVLAGCQCRCFDMTTITKLIINLNYLTPFDSDDGVAIVRKEYHNTYNDSLTLQTAFIRASYGDNDDIAGHTKYHLKYAYKRRHLVLIEDFEFSDYDHALLLLSNLTHFIGKGSLVIITTSSSTQLFNNKMDPMQLVRGTTCSNDFESMVKCYTVTKSKLLLPSEIEAAQMLSYQDPLDKKYTELNDLAQFESLPKKLKPTTL